MVRHYRVLRCLGTGGMAEVFLARDTSLERLVALKLMSPDLARDPGKRKRFRHEAKAASGLAHPRICVVYEVGEAEDGRPFLAMEYIAGPGLDRVLEQRRLGLREVLQIGLGVAEALEAAHARHLLHRDIKPGNIMLDSRGEVKVLDFGLAKDLEPHSAAASTSSVHTKSGLMIGTPCYMSPEQLLGRELDARADLFSLGVVLYEAACGQRPFLGRTVAEIANNVLNAPPQPLGLGNSPASAMLEGIIFTCLEKDRQKRYPSASALAEDLRRLSSQWEHSEVNETPRRPLGGPVAAPPPGTRWPLRARAQRGRRLVLPAALVLLGAALVAVLAVRSPLKTSGTTLKATTPAALQKSVAILPFDNFSGEPDTDYLSDGLTEEITVALGRVPGLRVAARNSAFSFKGKHKDARTIAQALHVGTLLEGSLRKASNHIRVTAELINAADGFQRWSETYEGSLDDLFGVQEDIARQITARLEGTRTPATAAVRKVDPQAYQLYLRGRAFWNNRTEPDLRRAITLFQEATVRDSAWAEAHAGLAAAYFVLQLNSWEAQPREFRPLALASAKRALELDPACAQAEAVVAEMRDYADDPQDAEAHFRRAVQLAPNDATAHQWLGLHFLYRGRFQEAWPELRKAAEVDPLSPAIRSCIDQWHFFHRDFDEAIRQARKDIEQFPDFPVLSWNLAAVCLCQGRCQEALTEIERARALQPGQPLMLLDMQAFALARLGREAEAREILDRVRQLRQQGKRVDHALALIYIGLREYDNAIGALEQVRSAEGLHASVAFDPLFDDLRSHPGYQALLAPAGSKE